MTFTTQYFRQLAVLLNSGIPLFQALQLISKPLGVSIEWDSTLNEVLCDVEQGSRFSEALAKHPKYFSDTQVQAMASAELSGRLVHALRWVEQFNELEQKVKQRLWQAALYPSLVVLVTMAISLLLFKTVLPKILKVSAGSGATFFPTKVLLVVSHLVDSGYILVLLLPALILLKVLPQSTEWKLKLYQIGWELPALRKLLVDLGSLRFASNLLLMLQSGTPFATSVEQALKACGSPLVKARSSQIVRTILDGDVLSQALALQAGLFSEPLVQMLTVAEETGKYGACLQSSVDFLEREVHDQIDILLQLLEPLILVAISGFVAFIALGSIVPVLQFASHL